MFDIIWISASFFCGLFAVLGKLPPLIGYLAAGFILHFFGIKTFPGLDELSEIGISLLLFSIGLKLDLKSLGKPQVLGVSIIQAIISFIVLFGINIAILGTNQIVTSSIIAFGLTFSSTVFVFKVLEQRGDFASTYGKMSIGVLIIQDIMAVVFMAFTSQKIPSNWLLLLIISLGPLRILLSVILNRLRQTELMILFGLTVSLGGAYLFDLVNVKGDIGALILGILLSKHERSSELNRWLISFKDFFLLGFFLSIGMLGIPSWSQVGIAFVLALFLPLRVFLYFGIFSFMRLRNRISFLASTALTNYSEFALIVCSFAVAKNLIEASWLVTLALTVSFSFIFSAILNRYSERLYMSYSKRLKKFERKDLVPRQDQYDLGSSDVMIIGMGRVGEGAYEYFETTHKKKAVCIEVDEKTHNQLKANGINIILGNATNPDFWDEIHLKNSKVNSILLAMPLLRQNSLAAKIIRKKGFKGTISSVSKYPNEDKLLREAGIDNVFNLYAEAGIGFARSTCE